MEVRQQIFRRLGTLFSFKNFYADTWATFKCYFIIITMFTLVLLFYTQHVSNEETKMCSNQ